ncbi:hypothetical protein B0T20DRAFT_343591 [Sordaria brevicollis]|uniref:Rhodopsin domain-containing protein n=1 Tax=Sordaria brevicollis TaxID=83679 RepID=A0AAE0UGT5_SORBR|nr:hypothetical protein B0T20DRAFT_343591 [Sordaria brevicollis]
MPSQTQPPPPSNLISNPSESHQSSIIACSIITWIIAAFFVTLRFYTRGVILRGGGGQGTSKVFGVLGAEDWVLLTALVMSGLMSGGQVEQAVYGLGKHALDVDPAMVVPMGKAGWYTILYYMLSLLFTKISISLLYIRILSYQHARYLVYLILGVVVATNGIWTLYTVVTACDPLPAFWGDLPGGKDRDTWKCRRVAYWYANTALHIGTDVLLYVLPLPVLVGLKVGWGRKVRLFLVLGLGGLVCLISSIRLWDLVAEASRPDFTFDNVSIAYLTCSEVNGAIVVACCMTLKPFFDRVFSSRLGRLLRLTTSDNSASKSDIGESDIEAQRYCKQNAIARRAGEGPPTIGSEPSAKRKGSWAWLYTSTTSSNHSRPDEGDFVFPNQTGQVHQLSGKGELKTANVKERDADLSDSNPGSPALSSRSEASWDLKEEVTVTKPVAVCLKG